MLTHAQLTECSKIYTEFAEKYGKLPKQFREMTDDFCKVFAEYLDGAVSVEIRQWFRAYLADYLPCNLQEVAQKQDVKENTQTPPKSETNKPENLSQKARRLRAEGKSYVEIGKILKVSDKTAKKLCESK